jgi:hypothetical protein
VVLKTGYGVADWIRLVQDKVYWWALVNTVMKLRLPQSCVVEVRFLD